MNRTHALLLVSVRVDQLLCISQVRMARIGVTWGVREDEGETRRLSGRKDGRIESFHVYKKLVIKMSGQKGGLLVDSQKFHGKEEVQCNGSVDIPGKVVLSRLRMIENPSQYLRRT